MKYTVMFYMIRTDEETVMFYLSIGEITSKMFSTRNEGFQTAVPEFGKRLGLSLKDELRICALLDQYPYIPQDDFEKSPDILWLKSYNKECANHLNSHRSN